MSGHALFRVRLRDRPAALERFLGLVRRRELAVDRLSVNPGPEGLVEVRFRLDEARTPPHRLAGELEVLVDLATLERLAVDDGTPSPPGACPDDGHSPPNPQTSGTHA